MSGVPVGDSPCYPKRRAVIPQDLPYGSVAAHIEEEGQRSALGGEGRRGGGKKRRGVEVKGVVGL